MGAADVRARLFSKEKRWKETRLVIPEIADEEVAVRELSARQAAALGDRARLQEDATTEDKLRHTAELLCMCLYTTEGDKIFEDGDADLLLDLPISMLLRVAPVVMEAAGLGGEEPVAEEKNG